MNRYLMVMMFGALIALPAAAQDSTATASRTPKARMDRFVDSDGDGICDQRARGLGFRRGQYRGTAKAAGGTVTPAGTGQTGPTPSTGRKQYHGGKR